MKAKWAKLHRIPGGGDPKVINMDSISRTVRMDVAAILYKQYDRVVSRLGHSPKVREALEHALTLVLSENRRAEDRDHLLRNVYRDGLRIVSRRYATRPEHEPFEWHEEMISGGLGNPEESLLAKEHAERLERIAQELGPDASVCAQGLLFDESISECASRTALPTRRIRYLRALIRLRLSERQPTE